MSKAQDDLNELITFISDPAIKSMSRGVLKPYLPTLIEIRASLDKPRYTVKEIMKAIDKALQMAFIQGSPFSTMDMLKVELQAALVSMDKEEK
jgi:hypothetical protein